MSSPEPGRPAPAAAPSKTELRLSKGASIGRHIILGPLGRGGMGEVYAAYDPELNRKIAIKLLHARGGAATVDGHTRLLREAQAIARLSHPNVVVVYDVGTFQDTVFIAMEFLEGHTLGYWLLAQRRSWREVVDVFLQAGRGLLAAHTAGLVHRDFKPDNVMITMGGQVRVMDFGLAREEARDERAPAIVRLSDAVVDAGAVATTIAPDVDPDTTMKLDGGAPGNAASTAAPSSGYLRLKLTQTGAMLGTPAYMAPEQFAGLGTDARTDQFAFSVALYEGVYGQRPFAGNDVAAVMANVVAGKLAEPPENNRVPGWIRKILLRGLSKRLEDRFPSMAELLAALSLDPATRQRRWIAALAGIVTLVAIGLGIHPAPIAPYAAGHKWAHVVTVWRNFEVTQMYKICNAYSGKCLGVVGGSTADGAAVEQRAYSGAASQDWQILQVSYGNFKVINVTSGKALDVSGTQIVQSTYTGSSGQLLPIRYIKDRPGYANLVFSTNTKSGYCVSSNSDGALVQLGTNLGTDYGRWTFTAVGPVGSATSDTTTTTTTTGGTNPCASFCASPTVFTSATYQAGALGAGASCRETTASLSGLNLSNIAGRTLKINGVAFLADGNISALPAKVNGGYCIQATTGGLSYASFATW